MHIARCSSSLPGKLYPLRSDRPGDLADRHAEPEEAAQLLRGRGGRAKKLRDPNVSRRESRNGPNLAAMARMNPSEARTQLLQEHARLRVLVGAAGDAAHRLLTGKDDLAPFRLALTELRDAFTLHNISEEALLEPLLTEADAWGPVRYRRMIEEHLGEHCAMRAALAGDELDIAPRMADLAEELLAHMEAEERTFLHPSVLRDDTITSGSTR